MSLDAHSGTHSANAADPPPRDAQPDPEPAPPSLPEPDPGVFHHDPPAVPTKPLSKAQSA
ncbi:MAG TPA: hypothetical protein VHY48_14520 [Acidobacteriaceae bacterium]|jgi:hypothetical protein|nr:hypothetical protein [Acidobacteriaceae bacterium]